MNYHPTCSRLLDKSRLHSGIGVGYLLTWSRTADKLRPPRNDQSNIMSPLLAKPANPYPSRQRHQTTPTRPCLAGPSVLFDLLRGDAVSPYSLLDARSRGRLRQSEQIPGQMALIGLRRGMHGFTRDRFQAARALG